MVDIVTCLRILCRDAIEVLHGEREQHIIFLEGVYILDNLPEINLQDVLVEMVLESEVPGMAVIQGNLLRPYFLSANPPLFTAEGEQR